MVIQDINTEDKSQDVDNIPHPPILPVVGNLFDLNASKPVQSMMRLARKYGPIYRLVFPGGGESVVVSGFELVDELCDQKRFDKDTRILTTVKPLGGRGLFTAETEDAVWKQAHNILMPSFSQQAMQGYFPMMVDIAQQLLGKWARLNNDEEIDVTSDMTRLTLDTIGLCGFNYRFNSFYRDKMHPFINSMANALEEAMSINQRLPIQNKLMVHKRLQFQNDLKLMFDLVDRVIRERRNDPEAEQIHDLLNNMLASIDKETGQTLDDENIRYQIVTFMIAGHETTSGLLSFALYLLLKHPEVLAKAYEEVDRILGADPNAVPTYAQVQKLKYTAQILKETLRLWPTAPAFAIKPIAKEETIGEQYRVNRKKLWIIFPPMLHRDKSVWGADADEFNPEHFSPEAEAQLPVNAYKPFGNGQRACIGRQFAMQEATLVLAMLLHRFELINHTNYQLEVKETLTLKPEGFKMRVRPRRQRLATPIIATAPASTQPSQPEEKQTTVMATDHQTPLLVLYGSNLGSTEALARRIAQDGTIRGFNATIAQLDDYTNDLPREGAILIVSASYNGMPPDNAVKFCRQFEDGKLDTQAFAGVSYSIFGCGSREWASTFQSIPRQIDRQLEAHGASRIYVRGEGDASDDFDEQFQAWYRDLWATLAEKFDIPTSDAQPAPAQSLQIELLSESKSEDALISLYGARSMRVLVNRELHTKVGAHASERSARHIEVALPEGVSYKAGDHLGILPRNSERLIERVTRHFKLQGAELVRLRRSDGAQRYAHLPLEQPIKIHDLLARYIELQEVATREQIQHMLDHCECPPEQRKLQSWLAEGEEARQRYRDEILNQRKTLLDLLEEFPSCTLPFASYLQLLPAMRPRYYSIASSPVREPESCSIAVSVVREEARSGRGTFEGTCSNYLCQLAEGDEPYAFIRDAKDSFRLPTEASTPLILIGPGTGVAPYRGFLQERSALRERGQQPGQVLLFYGCHHPEQDHIYAEEWRAYQEQGLLELDVAYSRLEEGHKVYVQDRMWQERERVWQLIEQGASIYLCGDGTRMAPSVRETLYRIYREYTSATQPEAEAWLQQLRTSGRYSADVWIG